MISSYQIIEKVKAHPSLWQLSHPYFSNRAYRARTWIKIAKSLQTTDLNTLKKRWKHLKDTYRKELKRLAANQVTTSSWVHFSDLEFLTDGQEEPHVDTEAAEKQDESSETESELEAEQIESQKEVRLSETKKMRYEQATLKPRVDTKSQTTTKFRKIMRSLSKLSNAMENAPTDRNLKNDTDYMFLVSLLPTMKKFSDVQRLHFRGKINNWLMNALMENEQLCDNKALVQAQINDMNKFTLPSKIMYCTALRDALTQDMIRQNGASNELTT